jgi:hypothetical protein
MRHTNNGLGKLTDVMGTNQSVHVYFYMQRWQGIGESQFSYDVDVYMENTLRLL